MLAVERALRLDSDGITGKSPFPAPWFGFGSRCCPMNEPALERFGKLLDRQFLSLKLFCPLPTAPTNVLLGTGSRVLLQIEKELVSRCSGPLGEAGVASAALLVVSDRNPASMKHYYTSRGFSPTSAVLTSTRTIRYGGRPSGSLSMGFRIDSRCIGRIGDISIVIRGLGL